MLSQYCRSSCATGTLESGFYMNLPFGKGGVGEELEKGL